ncbi:FxsA family protein [Parvularcula flava]|uniref:FxsA family protein n=1 Tax=Aquisalinus luteolus TaxID=1566827 RepID=A0A8J3ERG7_9PROT|nr:FxsA family protein [Aquisalinus luteolus]NHK28105.1 FxsA family protein [Aquisalinus luteolus]GGH97472.1 hypothetical protein GCM10011355_18790 [Aquisalinus luteolus]
MILYLFLLLIALPFIEIYVLIKAGTVFGAGWVILATIATAVIGGAILRWQGLQALNRLRSDMQSKQAPVEAVVDGVFLLIAVPFLVTPGFVTDAFGFLLLVPFVRHAIARAFLNKIKGSIERGETRIMFRKF